MEKIRKIFKLLNDVTRVISSFNSHVSAYARVADAVTEDIWNIIKTGLLKTTEEVGGTTLPHHWHRETWRWNEHMEKAIAAMGKAFKAWKIGKGSSASYDAAKRIAIYRGLSARLA